MKSPLRYDSDQLIEPGDQVRLRDTVRHKDVAGLTGTVKRAIKSRQIVSISLDNGSTYEAFPANVEPLTGRL